MSDKIRVMFTEEEVNNKIKELGAQISADMNGEPVKIICILKGASFFACELAKRITVRFSLILCLYPAMVTEQSLPASCVSSKIWMIPSKEKMY